MQFAYRKVDAILEKVECDRHVSSYDTAEKTMFENIEAYNRKVKYWTYDKNVQIRWAWLRPDYPSG